jgi:hypothetical protein
MLSVCRSQDLCTKRRVRQCAIGRGPEVDDVPSRSRLAPAGVPDKALSGMIRCRPRLAHFVALLLLLQWSTAFAHCLWSLAAAGAGHSVETCGAGGLIAILLDGEDRPVRKSTADHAVCPGCCGPVALTPPAPAGVPGPIVWPGETSTFPREGLPVAPARAPPQQPRAPPIA